MARGAVVALYDGKPVGYLQAISRRATDGITPINPDLGWITTFFVSPRVRRQGMGRELMSRGTSYLRSEGCKTVYCNGYAPRYVFPGVDLNCREAITFMEAMGYETHQDFVAMELNLAEAVTPASVSIDRVKREDEGLVIRPFEIRDTLSLLQFAEKCFPYWHQSLLEGLQIEHRNILVATSEGCDIVGFAQWENPSTDPPFGAAGRFGPFGVHPEMRNKGLGAILFYAMVDHALEMGSDKLWFGWAGGRNLTFYTRAGCTITRNYRMYKMALR